MMKSLPRPWCMAIGIAAALAAVQTGSAAADEIILGMSAAFRGPSKGLGIEL